MGRDNLRLMSRHHDSKVGRHLLGLKPELLLGGKLLCLFAELPTCLISLLRLVVAPLAYLIELVAEILHGLGQPIPLPAQMLDGQGIQ